MLLVYHRSVDLHGLDEELVLCESLGEDHGDHLDLLVRRNSPAGTEDLQGTEDVHEVDRAHAEFCIEKGLEKAPEDEGGYDDIVVATADLGFCELFAFKCAAQRTCDAWLVGGPITDEKYAKIEAMEEEKEDEDAA